MPSSDDMIAAQNEMREIAMAVLQKLSKEDLITMLLLKMSREDLRQLSGKKGGAYSPY